MGGHAMINTEVCMGRAREATTESAVVSAISSGVVQVSSPLQRPASMLARLAAVSTSYQSPRPLLIIRQPSNCLLTVCPQYALI